MRIIDGYGICPTNYKKGMLISNMFRKIDLVVLISCFMIGFLNIFMMFYILEPSIPFFLVFVLGIPSIGVFIIQPIPNYHNMMVYLKLQIKFMFKIKHYTSLVIKKKRKEKIRKKGGNQN